MLPRVFDFQVSYDTTLSSPGFSFFLFRWQEPDGRIFSASWGRGSGGSGKTIEFLGDDNDANGMEAIDDPTNTRVFELSMGKVIAQELRNKKVIGTLECTNSRTFRVRRSRASRFVSLDLSDGSNRCVCK